MRVVLLLFALLALAASSPVLGGGRWKKRTKKSVCSDPSNASPTKPVVAVETTEEMTPWGDETATSPFYFTPIHEGGRPTKDLLARAFLKYRCDEKRMYAFVRATCDHTFKRSRRDVYIKVRRREDPNEFGRKKKHNKRRSNNWIKVASYPKKNFEAVYEGRKFVGFEASFDMEPGVYDIRISTTTNEALGRRGGCSATSQGIRMEVAIAGECDVDDPTDPILTGELGGVLFGDCEPRNGQFDTDSEVGLDARVVDVYPCGTDTGAVGVEPAASGQTDVNGAWNVGGLDTTLTYFAVFRRISPDDDMSVFSPPVDGALTIDEPVTSDVNANGVTVCVAPSTGVTLDAGLCVEAEIFNDPHMLGFLGQRAELFANNKDIFSMISTDVVAYNAQFDTTSVEASNKLTAVITAVGLRMGTSWMVICFPQHDSDELHVTLNGDRLYSTPTTGLVLTDGSRVVLGDSDDGLLDIWAATPGFDFHFRGRLSHFRHLDVNVKVNNWSVDAHGILGQTKDAGHSMPASDPEAEISYDHFPTWLDGSLSSYLLQPQELIATQFEFSKFTA